MSSCDARMWSQSTSSASAPLDNVAANHLFGFVATAYETRSLIVTSNWPFEQ